MKHIYDITGMHCESCITKITEALKKLDQISDVEVSLNPPRAVIEMNKHIDLGKLNAILGTAGDYKLHKSDEASAPENHSEEPKNESLYPLFLIVGYITGIVLLIKFVNPDVTWADSMRHFMSGFFITFSFFKLLDLSGFASAYRSYDIIARRSEIWAYSYPFIELLLGIAYLVNLIPIITNSFTLLLMTVGAVGVLKALLDKQAIRCACLGTALNLPMTKVTLLEDLAMAAMAAIMLFRLL